MNTRACLFVAAAFFGAGCDDDSNRDPILQPVGDVEFRANQSGFVDLYVRDPDGDSLTWNFSMDPPLHTSTEGVMSRPALTEIAPGEHARFTWTPGAADAGTTSKDYAITVTVSDGRGGQDAVRFLLKVVNDGGVTHAGTLRFVDPPGAGMTVDPTKTPCVNFDVRVKGDLISPNDVFVEMVEPKIPTANLTGAGKDWHFNWCPTRQELAESLMHTVAFEAGHSNSDVVAEKRFLLRFKGTVSNDCAGAAPTISHTPPTEFVGPLNYTIDAKIEDDMGFKSPPYLVFSTSPALNGDTSGWELVQFAAQSTPNQWSAQIPNLDLKSGESETVYYQIIAVDNDDHTGTACDHSTESQIFHFTAKGGSASGVTYGACEPCNSNAQCGGPNDYCVSLRGGSYCAYACNNGGCLNGDQCIEAESISGVTSFQCLPIGLDCVEHCVMDDFELNGRNNTEITASNISSGFYSDLSICGSDIDFYKVPVESGQSISVRIDFVNSRGDLDLAMALPGDGGQYRYQSLSGENNFEQVQERCIAASGMAYIAVQGCDSSENTYSMSVNVDSGSCSDACTNDAYEETTGNNNKDLASLVLLPFSETSLQICRGDEDFYAFYAEEGDYIGVIAQFENLNGDLDIYLYDEMDNLLSSSAYSRDMEIIEIKAFYSGFYYLKVVGSSPSMANSYELWIESERRQLCRTSAECDAGFYCNGTNCIEEDCSNVMCYNNHTCVSLTAGFSVEEAGGRCASFCESDANCRVDLGYRCKRFEDYTFACAQEGNYEVGARCNSYYDCAGKSVCFGVDTGGYCTIGGCDEDVNDISYPTFVCPPFMVCDAILGYPACLVECSSNDDCRALDGHSCEWIGGSRACVP